MNKFKGSLLVGLLMLGLGLGASSSTAQAPRFTSLYTNLKRDCRAAIKLKRGQELDGQDMPLRCKGFGGYEIRIDYSAASSELRLQRLGTTEEAPIHIGSQPLDYDSKRQIEWRLANGKPFAIIYRIVQSKSDQPEERWWPENKTGESLVVKGLKGFEHIEFEIDAKAADANVKARQMADEAYARRN